MISDKFKKAGEFVKANCQADDFSFFVYEGEHLATRFAQNAITQHISGSNQQIYLTVAFGNQTGSASINQLNEESLKSLIETAENIARVNQPDPEYVPTEAMHNLPLVRNFYENISELQVSQIVDNIAACVEFAKKKEAKISGISEKFVNRTYLLTKNGFEAGDANTEFSHSMTLKKEGVETKVEKSVINYELFSIEKELEQLGSQFDSLSVPQKIEPGKYPVILRPQAVKELFWWIIWSLSMREADEGLTPLTGTLGKKVFGENFSLKSTLTDHDLATGKFDFHGLPAEEIDWIKDGVLANMMVSRYYAKEKGINANSFHNVLIPGSDISEEEMMKMVPQGLIINNLWYLRTVDTKKGEITGMTRDGVLFFENGEVKNSTVNLRFNEIPIEVTKRILALGKEVLVYSGGKVPSMLIDDFNFVDVTSF